MTELKISFALVISSFANGICLSCSSQSLGQDWCSLFN